METMMGTNEAIHDEVAERVKPSDFQNGPGAFIRHCITGMKFFYFHINIQNVAVNGNQVTFDINGSTLVLVLSTKRAIDIEGLKPGTQMALHGIRHRRS